MAAHTKFLTVSEYGNSKLNRRVVDPSPERSMLEEVLQRKEQATPEQAEQTAS